MQIIPVIDLKNGQAVHAKMGLRSNYQPINTKLCPSAQIENVVDAFLQVYPFKIIYLADLNALTGNGNHEHQINKLLSRYPAITFWVDAGFRKQFFENLSPQNMTPVLGSESMQKVDLKILADHRHANYILSLDFSATEKLGPPELFINPNLWPENIIIMPINTVGSGSGPDLTKINHYRRLAPKKNFIAAGGVRYFDDLLKLKNSGIRQVLIASALHDKTIQTKHLKRL